MGAWDDDSCRSAVGRGWDKVSCSLEGVRPRQAQSQPPRRGRVELGARAREDQEKGHSACTRGLVCSPGDGWPHGKDKAGATLVPSHGDLWASCRVGWMEFGVVCVCP